MAIRFFGGKGKNAFLSNFYNRPINTELNGHCYTFANGEAMFHAIKALTFKDPAIFKRLTVTGLTPLQAKRLGRHVAHYDDKQWAKVRLDAMETVERAKFSDPVLKADLIKLAGINLIENSPYDSFWGIGAHGHGANHLGKILSKLSNELANAK